MKTKGFTLVELIIVIAIVGIIAAIVMIAFNTSRAKAYDARIKMVVHQLRTLGEVYYYNNEYSFSGYDTCLGTPNEANCPGKLAEAVSTLKGELTRSNSSGPNVTATSSSFCVGAPLATDSTQAFCKDAEGHSELTETATVCTSTLCAP
ncbi:MAG TPA: prepilin-type N-terminal cleavage/methylation domain-containing protein [Candidatus Andersenbacteria bacterium]|nr:prepilin-type N-terminal cleavage/methylation domain-containing protein [Candidatus Andersenbacteria bacterium]